MSRIEFMMALFCRIIDFGEWCNVDVLQQVKCTHGLLVVSLSALLTSLLNKDSEIQTQEQQIIVMARVD
jgi:hypothetical protein